MRERERVSASGAIRGKEGKKTNMNSKVQMDAESVKDNVRCAQPETKETKADTFGRHCTLFTV